MKNIRFLNVILCAAVALPASGQTIWNQLPLTGPDAKIILNASQPRFNISCFGSLSLGNIASQNIELHVLQNAAHTPGTVEQLFEKLGGKFLVGNPSGQYTQSVEMTGQTQALPGFRLGFRLGGHFELRAAAQHYQSKWSGAFPVVVYPQQQEIPEPPQTLQGSISTTVSGLLVDIEMVFLMTDGAARPYLKGGVRGQFPMQNKSEAEIAGIPLPLEAKPVGTAFSPFGGAGVRVSFLKNGFVEAGCTVGKWSSGDYCPALEVGIGWRF